MIGQSFPTLEENPYIPTMLKNPIFTAVAVALLFTLVAFAQGPAPAPPAAPPPLGKTDAAAPNEPPTEAEKVLDAAIKKIAALKSVTADITQKSELLGQKFNVIGRYLKAPDRRLYLRLSIAGLSDSAATTLQVCDGKVLWDYQTILETPVYRKMDVVKVFEKLESPDLDPKIRDQIQSSLGFAGPESQLSGLRKAVKFDQKEEDTLDGKPVWVLHGTWRSRDGLMGPNQQPLAPTLPLPPYVPSVVSVWIGKEDGWPYKLLLLGKVPTILEDTRPRGIDGRPIGAKTSIQKVSASRVELAYNNVKLNPTLKIDEFVFQAPPGTPVEDNTEMIVNLLDQQIRVEASKKKAAESDEKLLTEPLEVPKTTTK